MTSAIRFFTTLVLVTLVFSITVRERTIFEHVYSAISPFTSTVQDAAEDLIASTVNTAGTYTKKLFHNSVPKVKDSVKSKLSGLQKKGEPEEQINSDEKQKLDELIKTKR